MQEHERWLRIVKEDLKVALLLLESEALSTAVYHCQQAAEKALKAYLVFENQEVIKTHDLMKLVVLCCKLDSDFRQLHNAAESLNPFATKFRYPTEFDIPDYKDTKSAVVQAQSIVNFVLKKISENKIGQQKIF